MPEKPYSSRYTYTDEELNLLKIIANEQREIEEINRRSEELGYRVNDTIGRLEAIAQQRGIPETRLEFLRQQARSYGDRRSVPEPTLSWDDIVAEANVSIPGYVTLEDICSAQDFEDAYKWLDEIDREFKQHTKLTTTDMAFIVIAIALQCARQYVLQPFLDQHRLTSKQNDSAVKRIIPKKYQDILCGSVPYDAIERLDKASERTELGGSTHRYRTLGHDPLLGWLFGPVSILSDTLTKTDFITSYDVINMKIGSRVFTWDAFDRAREQAKVDFNLPISVVRQGIHFGSDYFTKQGLPLPIISSVNNDVSKFLINNNINMLNVSEGMALSALINTLVSCTHGLFNTDNINSELYEVRTRKILSISNTIASASNIAYVAISKNIKLLDIGGLLITISRLCSDIRFIARVKQEFIEGKLNDEWARISEDIDRLCST